MRSISCEIHVFHYGSITRKKGAFQKAKNNTAQRAIEQAEVIRLSLAYQGFFAQALL